MNTWNYQVKKTPNEVIQKLESAFQSKGGFLFSFNENSSSFKLRKPVRYPDQILHRNRIVASGKIEIATSEATNLLITFSQDFYMKMTVFSIIVFGCILLALATKISNIVIMVLLGLLIVVIGLVFWKALQRKLEKDTQQYKQLISEVLSA